jgi:hypothetical protein
VLLRNAYTGDELEVLSLHTRLVDTVDFSSDGLFLVSGGRDRRVVKWSLKEDVPPLVMRDHRNWVTDVEFSPDGRLIASSSWDRTIRLWDAASGELLEPVLREHEDAVMNVAFSPDGSLLASAADDATVRLWSVQERRELHVLRGHSLGVTGVSFSPDGSRLATCSADHHVKIWDVERGVELLTLRGHEHWAMSVDFSSDGTRLLSASWDKTVRIWDLDSAQRRQQRRREARNFESLATPIVDRLLGEGRTPQQVAVSLEGDQALSDGLRRAGLNVLLRKTFDVEQARRCAGAVAKFWECRDLAGRAVATGRWADAERLHREARQAMLEGCGRTHNLTGWACNYLAWFLKDRGPEKLSEAEVIALEAIEIFLAADGEWHPDTLNAHETLAHILRMQARVDEATRILRAQLAVAEAALESGQLEKDHWVIEALRASLGQCLVEQGEYAEARELLEWAVPRLRERPFMGPGDLRDLFESMVELYEAIDRPDLAQPYRDDLEQLDRSIAPE